MSARSLLVIPNHGAMVEAGGVRLESAEAELLRSVRSRFERVGIAAFREHGDSSLAGRVESAEATLHQLDALAHGSGLRKLLNYIVAAARMPGILRRYDLVYIFCPGHCGVLAALWARLLRRRYALYVRCTWLNRRAATGFWWARIFAGASFMIVTGEPFRRRLLRYCARVVNEVPLTALRPRDVEPAHLEARSPQRLLFAGRLAESKGIYDVVRALAIVRREGWAVELVIAGGGVAAEFTALEQLCEALGVRSAVTLLGHVPPAALADAYRRSAIFVFPSYFTEGFPRVLYEAMMFSLAIVTCDMAGTQGFLVEGVNCLHCRPANPEQLAACLRRLLADPALSQRLGRRARSDVEELYESFTDASHAQQLLRFASST